MNDPEDVFAALRALVRPERLLRDPRATGEGVRVALLDTGVDRGKLAERARQRGVAAEPIEAVAFRPDPVLDIGSGSSPHGTTVADIVLSVAPRVRLYSADVFGPAGSCDVKVVIRAMRWAMDEWRAKVINLSLGVPEAQLQQPARRLEFQRVVEEAYYRDVLVVAAAHNDHPVTRSFPAAFGPALLSVDKGDFADPLRCLYRLSEPVEFQAHGRGTVGPFAAQPATSWAAPHLTGIAARLLSLRPTLKPFEVKALLYWISEAGGGSGQETRP